MPDLLLTSDKGLFFTENGDLALTSKKEEYAQRTQIALTLNLTEFFTHINYGLPWIRNPEVDLGTNLRYFLGDSFPDPEYFLASELDQYIAGLEFVTNLESSFSFNKANREFSYNFRIDTVDGDTVDFPPYLTTL